MVKEELKGSLRLLPRFLAIKAIEYGAALFVIGLLLGLKILYPQDWLTLLIIGWVFKGLVDWWFLPVKVSLVKEGKLEHALKTTFRHLPRYLVGMVVLGTLLFLPYLLVKGIELVLFVPVVVGNVVLIVVLGPLIGRIVGLLVENLVTLPLDVLITLPKYWFIYRLIEGEGLKKALIGAFTPFKEFPRWWKELTIATFIYSLVPSLIRDIFLLLGWIFWPLALIAGILLEGWAELFIIHTSITILKVMKDNKK